MKNCYIPLFLFLAFPSFLCCNEEKDLRQLHHTAESAMNTSDYATAKEAYKRILERIPTPGSSGRKTKMEWMTYIDLGLRLAKTHLALNELDEGEKVIQKLLAQKPPVEYLPLIKMLQCRFYCSRQQPGEAYLLLKEISSLQTVENWRGEDRSFFHSIEFMLNSYYDALLLKAKRFHSASYFSEAKNMYEELLEAIEKGYYPKVGSDSLIKKKVGFRLAEIHFSLANYEKALCLMEIPEKVEDKIDRQILYLTALVYQEKHLYEKALDYLTCYLQSGQRSELEHYEHALLEMGLNYYHIGNLPKAKQYFEALQQPGMNREKPFYLASIYAARIYLKEKKPNQAETLLSSLSSLLLKSDPLLYEIFYLRGQAAFEMGAFATAAGFFELSFPSPPVSGEWTHDALLRLGWCHLKLGEDPSKENGTKEFFFSKAEHAFRKLWKTKEHEQACLALARLFLLKKKHVDEEISSDKVENLLVKEMEGFSLEGRLRALLLRAEARNTFQERELLYSEATQPIFSSSPSYAESWYFKGLNYFQEGLSQAIPSSSLLEKAIASFEQAFARIEKKDPQKAVQLLKWEAEANFYREEPEEALKAFEKLLKEFPISQHEREEILYLRGLVASYLPGEVAFSTAKTSLETVIEHFPQGPYRDDCLYVLGTLYFQKKLYQTSYECFLKLVEEYPRSSWAGESFFWVAEAAEKIGKNPIPFRQKVYQHYPKSSHADEAFFRVFSLNSYVDGEIEALNHLKSFLRLFSKSPLRVICGYLLGIHASSFEERYAFFEQAKNAFALGEHTPSLPLVYFYYRSRLEQILLLSAHSNENVIPLLQELVSEFAQKDHPLTSFLFVKDPYPSLYEESEFALAQAFLNCQQDREAQAIFSQMLEHFSHAGVREGAHLARVWKKQGEIALKGEDHETALRCFKMARESGDEFLSIEQKLSLWISESDCYKGLNQLDLAMRMLSQVINEDAASPLRIKAMLLRAEIYALQGRHEFAIKQLEATAKKGGEWALEAKEKLKTVYGVSS